MEILIAAVATIAITLLIRRHCRKNLERLAAKQILFSEEEQAAFEDYRRNLMRFYCTNGTKLTVYKGKLIGKTKLKTIKAS